MSAILAGGTGFPTLMAAADAPSAATTPLPLIEEWKGSHGGLPPFDQIQLGQFQPAIAAAMTSNRVEIQAMANDPAAPTFENTIAALERCGRILDRVQTVYGVWSSTLSTPEFRAIEQEIEPQLAAFRDEIFQNEKLFRRLEAVYQSPDKARLTSEQQRLVWLLYTNFVRAGARLDAVGKTRIAAINQRLATLFTRFSQNLLADEEALGVVLDHEADLARL
ncbi:MAG: M3 family metallopeptidase, partial [Limisphaerales bacterium]